ncbi:hypothetical protein O181_008731 [Austropuccinia psidii MF-1]|uniref:Uncharacterized protein n=1 Tax=Austropuccinia psidii MF-1 TaxID=1389203 RepID=A0A9Q3GIT3_9BASI|nr:hypothetical protein [Austropuccinia psidii MF-1]
MCLAVWATDARLGYRLVLAFNRDEYLDRSSLPATWHSFDQPHGDCEILSGRDMVAGGTWLGIHRRNGKFAFLTNILPSLETNPDPTRATSRGSLIREFLQGSDNVNSYIARLKANDQNMNGYNLVVGQIGEIGTDVALGYHSNRDLPSTQTSLKPQNPYRVYGMSNGFAQQLPEWPKVSFSKQALTNYLKSIAAHPSHESEQDLVEEEIFKLMSQYDHSTTDVPSNNLCRPYHKVHSPDAKVGRHTLAATRVQTLLLVPASSSKVTFLERDVWKLDTTGEPVWCGDDKTKWRRFEFDLK